MTQRTAERVLEISNTTGTGPIKLVRPVIGFRTLADAGCVNGDTVDLMIESVSSTGAPTGDWEIGTYTWGAGGVLTRTTIVSSSNGGAAVDWPNGTRWVRARPGGTSVEGGGSVPYKVVGTPTIGNIAVATLGGDWIYDSVQWKNKTAAGVVSNATGAGATTLMYTFVAADVVPGAKVYPDFVNLKYIGGITAPATKPAAPTIGTATAGNGTVTVPFTQNSNGGSAILETEVLLINGVRLSGAAGATSITLTTANGSAVTGAARVRNAIGWSDWSAQSNAVTPSVGQVAIASNRFAIAGQTFSNSANNLRTSKVRATVNTVRGGTGMRFLFPNFILSNGGFPNGQEDISIAASVVTVPDLWWKTANAVGVVYPVTISAASRQLIAPGGHTWSDPVAGWNFNPGDEFDLIVSNFGSSQSLSTARHMTTGTRGVRQEGVIQASTLDSTAHDAYLAGQYGRGAVATFNSFAGGNLPNSLPMTGGNGFYQGSSSTVWAYDPDAGVSQNVGYTNAARTLATITSPSSRTWGVNTQIRITDGMTVDNTAVYTAAAACFVNSGALVENAVAFGDSNWRGYGAGDPFGDMRGNYGVMERVWNNQSGMINFSVLGGTASALQGSAWLTKARTMLSDVGIKVTKLLLGNANNDFAQPYPESIVVNANNIIIASFAADAPKVFTCTVAPRGASNTNVPLSPGFINGGPRDTYNSNQRAGRVLTTHDGYYEFSTPVEDAVDHTIWRTDQAASGSDFIHYSSIGIELVKATSSLHLYP